MQMYGLWYKLPIYRWSLERGGFSIQVGIVTVRGSSHIPGLGFFSAFKKF